MAQPVGPSGSAVGGALSSIGLGISDALRRHMAFRQEYEKNQQLRRDQLERDQVDRQRAETDAMYKSKVIANEEKKLAQDKAKFEQEKEEFKESKKQWEETRKLREEESTARISASEATRIAAEARKISAEKTGTAAQNQGEYYKALADEKRERSKQEKLKEYGRTYRKLFEEYVDARTPEFTSPDPEVLEEAHKYATEKTKDALKDALESLGISEAEVDAVTPDEDEMDIDRADEGYDIIQEYVPEGIVRHLYTMLKNGQGRIPDFTFDVEGKEMDLIQLLSDMAPYDSEIAAMLEIHYNSPESLSDIEVTPENILGIQEKFGGEGTPRQQLDRIREQNEDLYWNMLKVRGMEAKENMRKKREERKGKPTYSTVRPQ